jgi:hypothetical protein
MTSDSIQTRNLPFPEEGPQDGDVFFHKDIVCYFHGAKQTWECRRNTEDRQ